MANLFTAISLFASLAATAFSQTTPAPRLASPLVAVTGVANGADFSTAVAPGSLASLFGSALSSSVASAAAIPVATTLNGVTVNVNGRPAPITYLSPTQINFQVPIATPPGTASLTVTNGSQTSAPISFTVAAAAPGVFQYGANRGIIVNQDSSLNASDKTATVGSTVVAYLTGIGVTTPSVSDGAASPGDPLAQPAGTPSATIGGVNAPVAFLGLTPGLVGLAQANLQIPSLPTGNHFLVVTVNGRSSQPVLISVGATPGVVVKGDAPPGLPAGATCVSGAVDSVTFSLQSKASRLADQVSIGGNKLCATCDLKAPLYGNFVDKLEAARNSGLSADACYDTFGTLNYIRLRP